MKKNLITVIILALVLANLVLTAILAFTIIPQTNKSNQLIDQICTAIDLELESGDNADTSAVPVDDIEVYDVADSFTVNLKTDTDGKDHYAIFSVGISLNSKCDGYADKRTGMEAKVTLIKDQVNSIVQGYTMDEFRADSQKDVKADVLKSLQDMFGSDFVVGISFSGVTTQ